MNSMYTDIRIRKVKNVAMHLLMVILTLIAVTPLISIVGYIAIKGYRVINWEFLTSLPAPPTMDGGGIGPAIVGTVKLVGLASLMGIPTGILTAIYLNEYGKSGAFASSVRFVIDVLIGTPSIVIGIAAFLFVVRPMGHFSLFAGSVALAIMIAPIVARATEEILRLVPDTLREASYALGVPKWRTIVSVVIPYATKGIVTGLMLGVARIAGETAPLIMTAFGSQFWNKSIFEPTSSLPKLIYSYSTTPYQNWIDKAWGAALVLIFMVLMLNIIARVLTRGKYSRLG